MSSDITTPGATGTVGTKKGKKTTITNDNRETSNLEQHLLSKNLDKVHNYYLANQDLFKYKTYRQINGPSSQLVNKLRGIDNVDVFYKIKTSVLSLMQPKIRIYKVNYEEAIYGEDGTVDESKIVGLTHPCYKEFKFSDHFGQETAATVQDYLAYESTRPSWRNVGLQSFSISQNGESYGIIEQNINCNLRLSFKSLKDIQASPPGEPPVNKGGLRYVDLITWAPSRVDAETETYNPKHYEIKAIIGYTAPSAEQLSSLNLSAKDIQNIANIEKMNLIVGLSLLDYNLEIEEDGQVYLSAEYRGRIESVVGSPQVNVFQSNFQISRDGSVSLSKKIDANHNISRVHNLISQLKSIYKELKSPTCKDEKCKSRDRARKLISSDDFFKTILQDMDVSRVELLSGGDEAIFSWFKHKDNVKRAIATIRKKIGLYKKEAYKSFVEQLIRGDDSGPDSTGSRLFCINVDSDEMLDSMGVIFNDEPGTAGLQEDETNNILEEQNATSQTTAIPKGKPGVIIDRCHRVDPLDPDLANTVAQEIASAVDQASASQDRTTGDKKKKNQGSILNSNGETHKFYFVFLGDIVELACKNAGMGALEFEDLESSSPVFRSESYYPNDKKITSRDYLLKNMRILLGPVEYYDSNGNIRRINLAQFPISFNFFRAWFINKVIRRKNTQLSLGNFLTTLINDLVLKAMGAGMPDSIMTPRTRASFVPLSLPGKQVGTAADGQRVCGRIVSQSDELLPLERVLDVESASFIENYSRQASQPMSSESMVKTSHDYLLIYITTSKDITERRGDPVEDVRDGIYHFNIGSDMGLLKSMSFSKVGIPYLPELRSEESYAQGADSLEQLKIPYDTSLNLIGTALFSPGMFYYVNPSLAGLGSVESAGSLAYQMNLGGYHLIGQVQLEISPGTYETRIIGTQTSQGRR